MYQTRLESFFQASSPSPLDGTRIGLLHLPSSVRNRIYEYAGPFDEIIDLNFSNLLIYPYKHYPDRLFSARIRCAHMGGKVLRGCNETALLGEEVYWEYAQQPPNNEAVAASGAVSLCAMCSDGRSLLFVCKKISEEVLPLFYANNLFTVRQGAPYGLKRLSMMGSLGLTYMKSLTITLGTEDSLVRLGEMFILPTPLRSNHKSSRASLAAYKAVVKHLAEHVTPNRCELYLAFRIATFNLLDEVLLPLFQLPTLKHCGLSPFIGSDSGELAFQTWLTTTVCNGDRRGIHAKQSGTATTAIARPKYSRRLGVASAVQIQGMQNI
ncbi:hypothetical protein yc1106_06566 [Curvularia clavata]|uniref:Uncharacterized protein n=1 Tax=Curvularia clavata TaxID=95742 RepID=A0A9Q8ZBY7_CURCL|nr:hypothetical protein yc1106_06566 [Curvularia clavata]